MHRCKDIYNRFFSDFSCVNISQEKQYVAPYAFEDRIVFFTAFLTKSYQDFSIALSGLGKVTFVSLKQMANIYSLFVYMNHLFKNNNYREIIANAKNYFFFQNQIDIKIIWRSYAILTNK
jgi:hypothetical protein